MADIDIFCSLLYYMETSEIIRVPSIRGELRGMIIARNELAWHAKNRDVLPGMLKKYNCNSCFARTTCFIYHKVRPTHALRIVKPFLTRNRALRMEPQSQVGRRNNLRRSLRTSVAYTTSFSGTGINFSPKKKVIWPVSAKSSGQ